MNKLLKTEEVAEVLSVSLKTVQNLINEGDLPALRIGKNWRVDPVQFQHYLNNAGTPAYKALAQQGIEFKPSGDTVVVTGEQLNNATK